MKKTKTFLAAGSILTAALALTACGGNSSSSSSNKKELNWEESAEIPDAPSTKALLYIKRVHKTYSYFSYSGHR